MNEPLNFLYLNSSVALPKDKLERIFSDSSTTIHNISDEEFLATNVDHEITNNEVSCLLGRVATNSDKTDFKYLREAMSENTWPLSMEVSGNYSGFYSNATDQVLRIFTDAIGIYPVYYYLSDQMVIVSSSLSPIAEISEADLNLAGMYLEMTSHFSQFGRMTCWENVHRLLPGECLTIKNFTLQDSKFDYSIKQRDDEAEEGFGSEIITLIESENEKLYSNKNMTISLSGGIDSRVNLAPLLRNKTVKVNAINYGIEEGIDTVIPKKIAKDQGFDLKVIDPSPKLFPPVEEMFELAEKTDSLFFNLWHSIILDNTAQDDPDYLLLGDVLDILRSKRIDSLKSRSFRLKFYVKKFFFNAKLPIQQITEQKLVRFIEERRKKLIDGIEDSPLIAHLDSKQIDQLKSDVLADFEEYIQHLSNYKVNYLESYEELYGLFTVGRLQMGKQLNVLRFKYRTEIPLANVKILRKVLNHAPQFRYADELTHKMFRDKRWRFLGKYRTAQNPFTAYSSPLPIVLAGWAIRSKVDQRLIKRALKKKQSDKRLFKVYSMAGCYKQPEAEDNYYSYFKGSRRFEYGKFKERFTKRKTGESWPLVPMDLLPAVQSSYFENLRNKLAEREEKNNRA